MTKSWGNMAIATGIVALTFTAPLILAQDSETERIAISELKQKLESGEEFLLIDVREDYELERDGAIKGAIHIPMGELDARMKDIPKDIPLVFY
ncbi:MAG: rhodanese-like domain-containing protein [Acidobacteriota bacterium]